MSEFKYIVSNRVSKAQKKRDAKAQKKAEQIKRIEEAEKLDEHKDRRLEQEKLDMLLSKHRLKVYDIEADGDCLYGAVAHQLSICDDPKNLMTQQDVRDKTSQYMLDNMEDFIPFMLDDRGNLMDDKAYIDYCGKISKTKAWGGHLELTAISNITEKPIYIYQADNSNPIIIEPRDKKVSRSPIKLSFHKHLYHLGEHYNSLVLNDK